LKIKFCLKISASVLNGSVKKLSTPFIIQLATDSPGCTRAVITTPFFFTASFVFLLVIVNISHLLPAIDSQRTLR
jgi:hypothetical protein